MPKPSFLASSDHFFDGTAFGTLEHADKMAINTWTERLKRKHGLLEESLP